MASLVKQESDEIIAKEQDGKGLKYDYQTNTNILIGKLEANLIQIILENSTRRRKELYKLMLDEIKRYRIPIRPGRSFKRTKGLRANRNGLVQKSAL